MLAGGVAGLGCFVLPWRSLFRCSVSVVARWVLGLCGAFVRVFGWRRGFCVSGSRGTLFSSWVGFRLGWVCVGCGLSFFFGVVCVVRFGFSWGVWCRLASLSFGRLFGSGCLAVFLVSGFCRSAVVRSCSLRGYCCCRSASCSGLFVLVGCGVCWVGSGLGSGWGSGSFVRGQGGGVRGSRGGSRCATGLAAPDVARRGSGSSGR